MGVRKYLEAYGMSRDTVRMLLFERQDGLCGYPPCAEPLPKGFLHSRHVNIDHVIPRSHGGRDHIDNLALTHRACNLLKAAECPGCERCSDG